MSAPPRAGREFYRAHGLGNDYLVLEEGGDLVLDPAAVRAVCHRTRGVGSDGIVWVAAGDAPFTARGFNPDGSEFERSGNGLRVLASHLHRQGRVGDAPFHVRIGGDRVTMQVLGAQGSRYDVVVDMGTARVTEEERFVLPAGGFEGAPVPEVRLALVRVAVGNPHAVLWGDPEPWAGEVDEATFRRLGSTLAVHPAFPGGTNVQLARVTGPGRLQARVWERGVGPTEASGTSACAVAASAVATGRVAAGPVTVQMAGGTMEVTVEGDGRVRLRGPVEAVCTGRMVDGFPGDATAG